MNSSIFDDALQNIGAARAPGGDSNPSPQILPSHRQWFDRTGKPLDEVGQPGDFWALTLSPDEKCVALTRRDAQLGRDVWIVDLSTDVPTRVTSDPATEDDATWTDDGRALTFWSDRNQKYGIYKSTLGSSQIYLGDWSRDGEYLLAHDGQSIFALPKTSPRKLLRLINSPISNKDEPHFSPDGQWVAYSSDESGRSEVYVASFPRFDKRRSVSLGGGGVPWWRADGKELFYMSPEGKLMSVSFEPGSQEFGTPTLLFATPLESPSLISAQYVVARNGERFLVVVPVGTTAPITVVLDWTKLLTH